MNNDIINRLLPFIHDEMRMPAGMIKDVIEEIERLRATIAAWSQDISNLEDENQQLREQIQDCDNDFYALKQMFDNMRDLSYKWQNIANLNQEAADEIERLQQRIIDLENEKNMWEKQARI